MIRLTIDGKEVFAEPGMTVLEAARARGIGIPTLCYHKALGGFGACRMCTVEVESGGRSELVSSCLHQVSEGLIVKTRTPDVLHVRRTVVDLLLARCPEAKKVKELARAVRLEVSSFPVDEGRDNCVLCGICTRLCEQVGPSAISTVMRGPDKEVAGPFRREPEACIGCAVCAVNCPTENIPWEQAPGLRTIWERSFEMLSCPGCGKETITEEQARFFAEKTGLSEDYFSACEECSRRTTAETFQALSDFGRPNSA